MRSGRPRQRFRHVRKRKAQHRHDGGVFRKLVRVDLVKRIGSRVVVIEIRSLVLHRPEYRDPAPAHRVDVCGRACGLLDKRRSDRGKHFGDLRKGSLRSGIESTRESERMSGAQVAFDRRHVIQKRTFVFGHIGSAARTAVLLVHPGNDAQGASRSEPQLFAQLRRLHRHRHSSRVVERAGTEIPGIEVA
jgi:hypothetical protein